jgi:hypothetical protein
MTESMLEVLSRVEAALPALLRDEAGWQTLDIDYHPPHVERVWRPWSEYRVSLHRIHPCLPGEALFHPHPWPSAMRIVDGGYEMAVGYGTGSTPPPVAARIVGAGDFRYEMTEPDAWHYVRPIDRPAMTIMVTGNPWTREAPRSAHPLRPLDPERTAAILQFFQARFPQA